MPAMLERYQGCIVGLAVGDALGHATEFLSSDAIRDRYGRDGVDDFEPYSFHPPGTYTDDTQMALALSRALLEAGDRADLIDVVAREFVAWSRSPDNNRSPGGTCMAACRRLADGVPPLTAGILESKGCGSVMRVAPVGLYFHGDPDRLLYAAMRQGDLTHRHPAARISCGAAAIAVDLALDGAPPADWLNRIERRITGGSPDVDRRLRQLRNSLDLEPAAALPLLGEAWVAEEALVCALYCFLRSPNDFRRTVLAAANTNGDSDSIACIAGAFSGAFNGLRAIPEKWRLEVENSTYLHEIGRRIFDAVDRRLESSGERRWPL